MCWSYNRQFGTQYLAVMPTNLYGPGDNYHPENSHVIPGMIRRFHEAKEAGAEEVSIWGTGTPDGSSYTVKTWQMHVSFYSIYRKPLTVGCSVAMSRAPGYLSHHWSTLESATISLFGILLRQSKRLSGLMARSAWTVLSPMGHRKNCWMLAC